MNIEAFIKWCQELLGHGEAKVSQKDKNLFIGRVWHLRGKNNELSFYVDIDQENVFIELEGACQSIAFLDESFLHLAKQLVGQCYKYYQNK